MDTSRMACGEIVKVCLQGRPLFEIAIDTRKPSCPDLIRASIALRNKMECRAKPGNDELICRRH